MALTKVSMARRHVRNETLIMSGVWEIDSITVGKVIPAFQQGVNNQ